MKDLITTFAERINVNTNTGVPGVDTVGGGAQGTDNLPNLIFAIINGVIGVLGVACVVVIIVGGINYMTSSGDAAKVKKGKDTILYGLIGLVICVLAFAIVNFVIKNIIGGQQ